MNPLSNFKSISFSLIQVVGAMLAFVISLMISNLLAPLSPAIMEAAKNSTGFLATPLVFLFNAFANALILVWAARRSSLVKKGSFMVFS